MSEDTAKASQPHRSLAAIVFTDICGFSQLARQDEDRACQLAQRDLNFLRKLCQRSGGRVLKSTGDGLLMYFNSATQAVTCALKAQKGFADVATRLPADQVLQHRIGIHLGDVFVTSDDVMGDGVNVASRLQEQADPGGICVSQTVYDVVKNRLAVHATYLGPRDLKNIQEAVPVYQILADAAAQAGQPAVTPAPVANQRHRGWLLASILGGVAVIALAVIIGILLGGDDAPQQPPVPPQAVKPPTEAPPPVSEPVAPPAEDPLPSTRIPPRSAAANDESAHSPAPPPPTNPAAVPDNPAVALPDSDELASSPTHDAAARRPAMRDTQTPSDQRPPQPNDSRQQPPEDLLAGLDHEVFADAREKYLSDRNISGLITWMEENGYGETPMAANYRDALAFVATMRERLDDATAAVPLAFNLPSPQGQINGSAWLTNDERIIVQTGRRRRVFTFAELPMRLRLAIAMAVAETPDETKLIRFLANEVRLAAGPETTAPPASPPSTETTTDRPTRHPTHPRPSRDDGRRPDRRPERRPPPR
jgi:class 3 adenylate cyclase